MSETPVNDGEETPTDFAEKIRHKIDDAIDVVEEFAAEKVKGLPVLMQPFASATVDGAFATIRQIIGIPDDIGGDAD